MKERQIDNIDINSYTRQPAPYLAFLSEFGFFLPFFSLLSQPALFILCGLAGQKRSAALKKLKLRFLVSN